MADEWDKYIAQEQTDDWEQFATQEQPQSKSSLGDLAGGALGLGALGLGAGAIGTKMVKNKISSYREPFDIRNEYARQLVEEQKPLGLTGRPIYSLPKEYGRRISQTKGDYSTKLNAYNLKSTEATKILQQRLSDFDSSVLNQSLDDTAITIKTKSPEFFNSTYSQYKSVLDDTESIMKSKNIQLTTLDFDKDVIQKTVDSLKDKIPEEKLSSLKTMIKGTDSERPITISQAKKYMETVGKDLPSEGKYRLGENWGNFLEKNAPEEVVGKLSSANKSYKPIAELRTKLNSLSRTATGEFDDAGIYRLLKDYVKKGQDTSTKNLLSLLKEGNDLATGIEGLGDKVSNLEKAGNVSKNLDKSIQNIGVSRQKRIAYIKSAAKAEIDRLTALQNKSIELVDKAKVSQKLVNARSIQNKLSQENVFGLRIPRPVQDIAKVGKQAIPMMSVGLQGISGLINAVEAKEKYPKDLIRQLYSIAGQDVSDEAFKKWKKDNAI